MEDFDDPKDIFALEGIVPIQILYDKLKLVFLSNLEQLESTKSKALLLEQENNLLQAKLRANAERDQHVQYLVSSLHSLINAQNQIEKQTSVFIPATEQLYGPCGDSDNVSESSVQRANEAIKHKHMSPEGLMRKITGGTVKKEGEGGGERKEEEDSREMEKREEPREHATKRRKSAPQPVAFFSRPSKLSCKDEGQEVAEDRDREKPKEAAPTSRSSISFENSPIIGTSKTHTIPLLVVPALQHSFFFFF